MSQNLSKSRRPADRTRNRILHAAFLVMYRQGFQGMRLDDVIEDAHTTKGALYHHFVNKQALGYAVVDEIVSNMLHTSWIEPLEKAEDPVAELIRRINNLYLCAGEQVLVYGCPINNLAQEMSPLDEGFRSRLNYLLKAWEHAFAQALRRGKEQGILKDSVDPAATAVLIMAMIEGSIGMAKNAQEMQRLIECQDSLVIYIESLKN